MKRKRQIGKLYKALFILFLNVQNYVYLIKNNYQKICKQHKKIITMEAKAVAASLNSKFATFFFTRK